MTRTIQAIFEHGVLRPLGHPRLPARRTLTLRVLDAEDIPGRSVAKAGERSRSYLFLKNKKENLYSLKDGRPLR